MNDIEVLLDTGRFRVVRQRGHTAGGKAYEWETVQHPGAVTVLPWVDEKRICLIRNFRPPVGETLIELPAGTLEAGESPEETAARELQEETGYRAARLRRLCEFYMSPGIINERMYLFEASGLTPGERNLDAGEEIEPLVVTWEKALEMVAAGEIQDAKTLVGLLWRKAVGRRR